MAIKVNPPGDRPAGQQGEHDGWWHVEAIVDETADKDVDGAR